MKKLLLSIAFVALAFNVNAQEKGDFNAFIGAEYVEDLGLNVGLEYLITDKFSIAPSFTYWFTEEIAGVDTSQTTFNIDARYYFGGSGDLNFYGLVGYGHTSAEASAGGSSVSLSTGGVNVGLGGLYSLGDNVSLMAQAKYWAADGGGDFIPFLGVKFGF